LQGIDLHNHAGILGYFWSIFYILFCYFFDDYGELDGTVVELLPTSLVDVSWS